jgi:glutaredoxin-related protein
MNCFLLILYRLPIIIHIKGHETENNTGYSEILLIIVYYIDCKRVKILNSPCVEMN